MDDLNNINTEIASLNSNNLLRVILYGNIKVKTKNLLQDTNYSYQI